MKVWTLLVFFFCNYFTIPQEISDHHENYQYLDNCDNKTPDEFCIDQGCFEGDSSFFAGHMYWYGTDTFLNPPDLVLLGKVIDVRKDTSFNEENFFGKLKIEEILYTSFDEMYLPSNIKYMRTNIFDDYVVGDSAIVLLYNYEGCFAIPNIYYNNTLLGIKKDKNNRLKYSSILALFRSKEPWKIETLSDIQLSEWAELYPVSLSFFLERIDFFLELYNKQREKIENMIRRRK